MMVIKTKEELINVFEEANYEVYTHGGIFHADDVFATALLKSICPAGTELKIHRVFKVPEGAFAYDIGGGQFDHHQGIEYREGTEIPYAAFGKLWAVVGADLVGEKAANTIDAALVQPIDLQDNGVENNPLSKAISNFNPSWDSEVSVDVAFDLAVDFAFGILEREIKKAKSIAKAESLVDEAAAKRDHEKILVLEQYVPYISRVQEKYLEICFVVYPSLRGGWNCNTVPNPGEKQGKVLFPEAWLGQTNDELGITFCHQGNFLLSTNTREQAIHCAELALEKI